MKLSYDVDHLTETYLLGTYYNFWKRTTKFSMHLKHTQQSLVETSAVTLMNNKQDLDVERADFED